MMGEFGCHLEDLLVLNVGNGWEWGVAGIIIHSYGMGHSLIPDLKHQQEEMDGKIGRRVTVGDYG